MLKENSGRHYGTAVEAFVHGIQADMDAARRLLRTAKQDWLDKFVSKGSVEEVRRVAGVFAHLAASGELATKLGVHGTYLKLRDMSDAVGTMYKLWEDWRGGATAQLDSVRVVQIMRTHLETEGHALYGSLEEVDEGKVDARQKVKVMIHTNEKEGTDSADLIGEARAFKSAGFYHVNKRGNVREFLIYEGYFREVLYKGENLYDALKTLTTAGVLKKKSDKYHWSVKALNIKALIERFGEESKVRFYKIQYGVETDLPKGEDSQAGGAPEVKAG
jgi:hypothetical protein